MSLIREKGIAEYGQLLDLMKRDATVAKEVIDLMTTNETLWFRDSSCWDMLEKQILPQLIDHLIKGERFTVRIWSAASSTGQEAYSLAILLHEQLIKKNRSDLKVKFSILGIDISPSVVDQARLGVYDSFSIGRGLSGERKATYFEKTGETFRLKDEYKSIVSFQQFNLLNSYALFGKFDLVLCRNVLIYFSDQRKTDILSRLSQTLQPGGNLILGATESVFGLEVPLESVNFQQGVCYRLKK